MSLIIYTYTHGQSCIYIPTSSPSHLLLFTKAEHHRGIRSAAKSTGVWTGGGGEPASEGHGSPRHHGLAMARPEPAPDSLPARAVADDGAVETVVMRRAHVGDR